MPSSVSAVDEGVRERVEQRRRDMEVSLSATYQRRQHELQRLAASQDAVDRAVARVYADFLTQVEEVEATGESMLLAADGTGESVVGRLAVFDEDRNVLLTPWHAPEGQRVLTSPDRLLVSQAADGSVDIKTLASDPLELARDIRARMRRSAASREMADPLNTLTEEQGQVLHRLGDVSGVSLLHGPPGSGKSALVLVELARRLLTRSLEGPYEVLFVTGSTQLAERVRHLSRILGVGSISPVVQSDLLRHLGVSEHDAPVLTPDSDPADERLPERIRHRVAELTSLLDAEDPVPHPLRPTAPADLASVREVRARAGSLSYRQSVTALRRGLEQEYAPYTSGQTAKDMATQAQEALRPSMTPARLAQSAAGRRLSPGMKASASTYASLLLDRPANRRRSDWHLIVVDEYQRVPAIIRATLAEHCAELLLSGDPRQAAAATAAPQATQAIHLFELSTSLRLPGAIADWIDTYWVSHGLGAPGIRSAAPGGEVTEVASLSEARAAAGDGAQAIDADGVAPETIAALDSLGLEWPCVVLDRPADILSTRGEAALFIAATRAIDHLVVVGP